MKQENLKIILIFRYKRKSIGNDVRANKKLIVVDTKNKDNQVEYLVPKGKHNGTRGDIV